MSANPTSLNSVALHVIASEARQSPVPANEVASSLHSSQ
jgi:hypothetical protein